MDKPILLTNSILDHLKGLPVKVKHNYVGQCLEFEHKIIESIIKYKRDNG